MSVASLTIFKIDPSFVEEGTRIGLAIKEANIALGAERMVSSQFMTGQYTGDWLVMTRAPDMATLEKILRALPSNPDFQKMMASGKVSLVGRNFVDIPEGF